MRKGLILAVFCLILSVPLLSQAAGPEAKPNVLLITLDTTRADRIDCIRGGGDLTPSLDMLARRSFVFTHCETAVPLTLPSHVTIMSGWNPNRHGVRKNLETTVSPKVPLLAEEFRSRGYQTGAFISASVLLGKYGLKRGFDVYNQSFYDPRNPDISTRRGDKTLKPALAWIEAQGGRPWFCWVHLYDPHYPYDPPMPFAARYKKNPYDGEIAFMDAALGGFFQGLHRAHVLSGALVVVCGDHGEALGQHGEESHGVFLYEATTHVPLIVHLPGESGPKTVAGSVGLVDVAPTIRDLAGLKAVPGDGESLSPLMKGGKWTPRPIYMESLDGLYNYGWAPLYGLVKWPWKYILAPKPELYDLAKDPGEIHNLVRKDPGETKQLKKLLQARITGVRAEHGEPVHLSREELKSLQSLGYIAGSMGKASGGYRDPKDMVS
ncbi:MAG: sulfatase, partial [Acidobacteriota bacterium]